MAMTISSRLATSNENAGPRRKTTKLRELLTSPDLSFIMEAHNGLSAKVAEEAGFDGIWGSGLSISAALGCRDNNEASWTQVLEVVEFMSDATSAPILLDGDTGYGNFNSMRRLVRKLEQRGCAGVCIEDKLFPKTNSFLNGTAQPLADIDEFAGKIAAGKDAQNDDDFVIVARVEAFIAGYGLSEALKRAEAYRVAGADAILIHSALRQPTEIFQFMAEWGDRLPVVIVPTKYYTTPTEFFRDQGISTVVWANHLMRSALQAMQATANHIHEHETLVEVEDAIAPLSEVFRIQGQAELEQAEERYLPHDTGAAGAIVLASSRGEELGSLTDEVPKTMVPIKGIPLLGHIASAYRGAGVTQITAVRGYMRERVDVAGIDYVDNDEFDRSHEVVSLLKAVDALHGPMLISYGDVMFKRSVIQQLLDAEDDFVVCVDANWRDSANRDRSADYVVCSDAYNRYSFLHRVTLERFEQRPDDVVTGEWMGFLRTSTSGSAQLASLLRGLAESEPERLRSMSMPDLLEELVARGHEVRVLYSIGNWLDIDSVEDVVAGASF
jgi:phosphoenolpyruvate phosphomutase